MSARRPCDACGGTGYLPERIFPEMRAYWACPACSGRGWQSDAMPVSDALADAETLLRNANEPEGERHLTRILLASQQAINCIENNSLGHGSDEGSWHATTLGHAAFSAVPGLRG